MKTYQFLTLLILVTLIGIGCEKEGLDKKPNILLRVPLPDEMQGRWHISSPIVFEEYLIVSGRDPITLAATFFKLNNTDGTLHSVWNEVTIWGIDIDRKYLWDDKLYFNNRREQIIAIDLHTMKTLWRVPANTSRDGFFPLKDKIYITRYLPSGVNYYSIDLVTQEEAFAYSIPPIETGIFAFASNPCFYEINASEVGILVTTKTEEGFVLLNFNITQQQPIWQTVLHEFNTHAQSSPIDVQLINDDILVNSLDYMSHRKLDKGTRIWQLNRQASQNIEEPVINEELIVSATDKLFCYDMKYGNILWTREDGQDGIAWGSGAQMLIYDHLVFMYRSPMDLQTGEAYWIDLDRYGNQTFEFTGLPGIDPQENVLYYTNSKELFKIEMPK
jgi:outer membrane protein assembly factor BamB